MAIRVLLVDDEPALCHNVTAFLEDEGMVVSCAGTGEEAVEKICAGEHFDVCIMDMRLPGMDGNASILALHKLAPALRFLVHTGSANYGLPPALRDIGMTTADIFMKPLLDMMPLVRAVEDRASGEGGEYDH